MKMVLDSMPNNRGLKPRSEYARKFIPIIDWKSYWKNRILNNVISVSSCPKIFPVIGRISKRKVVDDTHQACLYNFQKTVCRYLVKQLRNKILTILGILKKSYLRVTQIYFLYFVIGKISFLKLLLYFFNFSADNSFGKKNYRYFERFPPSKNEISFSREARRKFLTFCAEGAENIFLRPLLFLVEAATHTLTLTWAGA